MPFLLDGGLTCGCPDQVPAPNDPLEPFRNHFHIDPATGCVYIDECDRNFRYLGSARWDDGQRFIGTANTPANGSLVVEPTSSLITRTVCNTSGCDLGIILGYDVFAAFDINAFDFATSLNMTGFYDIGGGPVPHATVSCFSTHVYDIQTAPPSPFPVNQIRIRTPALASANPLGAVVGFIGPSPIEDGTPALVLAPGDCADFTVQLSMAAYFGAPNPVADYIDDIQTALRIYAYSV